MREVLPTRLEWIAAGESAGILILAFPNIEGGVLAWVGLVPLLWMVVRRPSPVRGLILGWAMGTVFFYGTCYWLTYSMIHYGGLPPVVAYLLLAPATIVVGLFPGVAIMLVALVIKRWGQWALLLAPIFWTAFEWIRLGITGQLWNALGYSQAFHWWLIQPATWGGVYAVTFLIVAVNAAIVLAATQTTRWRVLAAVAVVVSVGSLIVLPILLNDRDEPHLGSEVCVVAVQPNVPMTIVKTPDEMKELLERHLSLSLEGLKRCPAAEKSYNDKRLVIWPESPMNFTYAANQTLQQFATKFSTENGTYLLFNSLEPAPGDGAYNSAILINGDAPITQYDKIRLMPFGEYVPLPQWLPGASLITGLVGDFTPGDKYTLMPVGSYSAGVFICIESAYPWIAREMTSHGADLLINISNDGYLGPTAVMRQHLANTVFRAVENGRPLMRVTNTGLTARIDPEGRVQDLTDGFQTDVRVWKYLGGETNTFYTRHGDLFVQICVAITALLAIAALVSSRRSFADLR